MKRQQLLFIGFLVAAVVIIIGLVWLVIRGDDNNNGEQSDLRTRAVPTASVTNVSPNIEPTSTLRPWNVPGIPLGQEAASEADRLEIVLQDGGYDDVSVLAAPFSSSEYQIMVSLPIDSEMGNNPQAMGDEIAGIEQLLTDAEMGTEYLAIHFLVGGQTIRWQARLPLTRELSGDDLFYFGGPAPTPMYLPT